jgi:hypothetical protein
MDPTAAEALDQLSQLGQHGGLMGPCHVLTFCGLRQAQGGTQQEVTVDILDRGPYPRTARVRYSAHATTADGKFAAGNPADSVRGALLNVHWHDLDK